jgi:hypothetical protein
VKPSELGWQLWRDDVWLATYSTRDRAFDVAEELARRFNGRVIRDSEQGDA